MKVFPAKVVRALVMTLATLCTASLSVAQTTVSFQQGINDYQGTINIFIGPDAADIPNGADGNTDGAFLNEDYMDGKYMAEGRDNATNPQELQMLLRFDEIFGNGPGQIPLGSKITNATLTLTTGNAGNAQSNGPYCPAQLLVPFDTTTTWNMLGGDGATYSGGESDRPLDRGFDGMTTPSGVTLMPADAEVTSILQNWSSGQTVHGFVVRAGSTDGWSVYTTGVPTAEARPKLTVTYEPAPTVPVTAVALQQNVGGYVGTTMAWVQGPCLGCSTPRPEPITTDGATLDGAFIDGANAAQTSPDDLALIKFDNIFTSQGGSIPDNATVLSAKLIVDSTSATFSANVDTQGDFGVHQMLVDWNTSTLYSEFGTNGLEVADGEIGPVLDVSGAVIADSRAQFDVLAAVEAWQEGAPNYGLSLQAETTDNGWSILWLGSSSPPQLVIEYTESAVGTDGDFDSDGDVDGRDFLAWQRGESPTPLSASDLSDWQVNYGGGAPSISAVPEPTSAVLMIACGFAIAGLRKRID